MYLQAGDRWVSSLRSNGLRVRKGARARSPDARGGRLAASMRFEEKARRPVSRVLFPPKRATIIPLDRPLLTGSRDLPGRLGR